MVYDADANKTEGANHCFSWGSKCVPTVDAWNPTYLGDCSWCLDSNLQWLHAAFKRFATGTVFQQRS